MVRISYCQGEARSYEGCNFGPYQAEVDCDQHPGKSRYCLSSPSQELGVPDELSYLHTEDQMYLV